MHRLFQSADLPIDRAQRRLKLFRNQLFVLDSQLFKLLGNRLFQPGFRVLDAGFQQLLNLCRDL